MEEFRFACVCVGEDGDLCSRGSGGDNWDRSWILWWDKRCGTEGVIDCVGDDELEETQSAIPEVTDDGCGVGAEEQFEAF